MDAFTSTPEVGQLIRFKFAGWVFPGRNRDLVTWPDGRKAYASIYTGVYTTQGVFGRETGTKLCRWESVIEWWPLGEEDVDG